MVQISILLYITTIIVCTAIGAVGIGLILRNQYESEIEKWKKSSETFEKLYVGSYEILADLVVHEDILDDLK